MPGQQEQQSQERSDSSLSNSSGDSRAHESSFIVSSEDTLVGSDTDYTEGSAVSTGSSSLLIPRASYIRPEAVFVQAY